VVKKGELVGIPTPYNKAVTKMNQMIEEGKFTTAPENLSKVKDFIEPQVN
jgi:hypothetical protein